MKACFPPNKATLLRPQLSVKRTSQWRLLVVQDKHHSHSFSQLHLEKFTLAQLHELANAWPEARNSHDWQVNRPSYVENSAACASAVAVVPPELSYLRELRWGKRVDAGCSHRKMLTNQPVSTLLPAVDNKADLQQPVSAGVVHWLPSMHAVSAGRQRWCARCTHSGRWTTCPLLNGRGSLPMPRASVTSCLRRCVSSRLSPLIIPLQKKAPHSYDTAVN